MKQQIVLFGIVGTFVALAGCSGASTEPSQSSTEPSKQQLTLKLQGEGKELKLVESGRKGYAARYPNTEGVIDMFVRLKATGAIVSQCHDQAGVAVRCNETPFFTSVEKRSGSTVVKVTDIYGEPCGEEEFSDEEVEAEEEASASDSDALDDDEVACSCPSDPDSQVSSDVDADGDSCDENSTVARRDAFCEEVNEYLKANDFAPIDCETLESPIPNKGNPRPPEFERIACHKIWRDVAYKPVNAWVKNCRPQRQRAIQWGQVMRWQLLQRGACQGSPIVLDLDDNGFSASTPENGVRFDLLGVGPVQTAWLEGADAFLALDRDGNGRIDGATELFGNATRGAHFDDGFAALAELDTNEDGLIDARDAAYSELVLWRDANHDGKSSASELTALHDAGIRSLYLSAGEVGGEKMFDANRNRIPLVAGFEYADGRKGAMADIFLRFKP